MTALAGVALVASLVACDPIDDPDADAALQVVEGVPVFVVCHDVDADLLLSSARDFSQAGSSWDPLVENYGPLSVHAGAPIAVTNPRRIEVRPGMSVSFLLREATGGDVLSTEFLIPDDWIGSDSTWLTPSGELVKRPC
ncbi:hypothetical protein [Antiquaquibacter soli]|uniref:Uncharacterized protein n=1 Tax=Antiquaquibacter soli TaxID=3064523 RepID=A0ABT9BI57_9MICO|nr:hypothetical protein [Protaetiibacter sp. WY-16]MDO7880713.1 hypothetical protein [Protaetiibacter sp. WY-16]